MRKTKPWVPSKFWDNMRPTSRPVEKSGQFGITFDDQKHLSEYSMRWYDRADPWHRDQAKESGWW